MKSIFSFFATGLLLFFASCASDQIYHKLTVVDGSGSGEYAAGTEVEIQADTAADGFAFYTWLGDTQQLENARGPVTRLTMPLADVRVQAQFLPLPTYLLTVEAGSGSGRYLEGTRVLVKADQAPQSHVFDSWSGDEHLLDDEDEAETYLTMPAREVSLTANYRFSDEVSFSNQVLPIVTLHCSLCHLEDSNTPFYNYATIYPRRDRLVATTQYDMMPPSYALSPEDKAILKKWVEQGAKNN